MGCLSGQNKVSKQMMRVLFVNSITVLNQHIITQHIGMTESSEYFTKITTWKQQTWSPFCDRHLFSGNQANMVPQGNTSLCGIQRGQGRDKQKEEPCDKHGNAAHVVGVEVRGVEARRTEARLTRPHLAASSASSLVSCCQSPEPRHGGCSRHGDQSPLSLLLSLFFVFSLSFPPDLSLIHDIALLLSLSVRYTLFPLFPHLSQFLSLHVGQYFLPLLCLDAAVAGHTNNSVGFQTVGLGTLGLLSGISRTRAGLHYLPSGGTGSRGDVCV